ncbi:MAG TPA: hypothetical protein VFJ79_07450 [Acidimicrobiales bacterium]|nr:hypothetical protein [Acidimicrobiales bacterium]
MRLVGGGDRFGDCLGKPLAELEIRVGHPVDAGSPLLWSQQMPDGSVQQATVGAGGEFVLETGPDYRVSLSSTRDVVTVAEPFGWVETQLVASFVIPFLVAGAKTLVLHAAAACRKGEAVLIAGPGGTGKSSSLVALVEAGWAPLSEDVCVVDLSGREPVVWPGPPWVRRHHGEPGPRGSRALFESSEKTAWDVTPFREATGPVPVGGLVLLGRPVPGALPVRVGISRGEAIGALAPHAVWLGDSHEAGRRLFAPVAEAAARIPASELRLPVAENWVDLLVPLLG